MKNTNMPTKKKHQAKSFDMWFAELVSLAAKKEDVAPDQISANKDLCKVWYEKGLSPVQAVDSYFNQTQ